MSDSILDSAEGAAPAVETTAEGSDPAATPSAFTFKDFVGDDGALNDKYVDKYMEYDSTADRKAVENHLKNNGNLNAIIKQSLNLNQMLGKEKIPLPGEDAAPEVWDEFYEKIKGYEDDYKFTDEQIQGYDEETLSGVKEFLKDAKVPQNMADRLIPKIGEMLGQQSEAAAVEKEAQISEALSALESAWGSQKTPEFQSNLKNASQGLKILAADMGVENIKGLSDKYGNDAFLLQVFAQKAMESGEGGIPAGSQNSGQQDFSTFNEKLDSAQQIYFKNPTPSNLEKVLELRKRNPKNS